jgi:hypothetical protein
MNMQRPYGSLLPLEGEGEDEVGRKQLSPTAIKTLTSILSSLLRRETALAEIE